MSTTLRKTHTPADLFAMKVIHELSLMGVSRERAIAEVQSQEAYIRKTFQSNVQPAFVARNIAQGLKGKRPASGSRMAYVGFSGGEQVLPPVKGGGFAITAFEGREPGRDAPPPQLSAQALVCTSTDWQPALFMPVDEIGNDNTIGRLAGHILSPDLRRLFVAGRGQVLVDPEKIAAARAAAKRVKNPSKAWLAEERAKASRIDDPRERAKRMRQVGLRDQQREKAIHNVETQIARSGVWERLVSILETYPTVATNAEGTAWQSGAAMFAEESGNEKIESHSGEKRYTGTTYTSIEASCPSSCVLKYGKDGKVGSCYAQNSNNIRPIVLMLDAIAVAMNHGELEVAQDEARALDAGFQRGIKKPTDIRLHTSGDTRSPAGARTVAAAVARLARRRLWEHDVHGKGPEGSILAKITQPLRAWSYTHAWRAVSPSDWGMVSVLASIQTAQEGVAAAHKGWATTIVVPPGFFRAHAQKTSAGNYRSFTIAGDVPIFTEMSGTRRPIKYIPCPAQHEDPKKRTGCVNCRLCFDAPRLHAAGYGIAFEAHGSGAKGAATFDAAEQVIAEANRRRLPVIG